MKSVIARACVAAMRVVCGIGKRIIWLSHTLDIEGSELYSIGLCLSWYLPLSLYERIMGTSVYLRALESDLPRPWLMAMVGSLLLFQSIGVLLGGYPSAMLNTPRDVVYWLHWRRAGLIAAIGVWAVIGVLLSLRLLTPGVIVYGWMGAGSAFWGMWRLSKSLVVEREVRGLRDITRLATAPEALPAT